MNTKTATSAEAKAKSKKTMLNELASAMITDLSALSGLSAKSATEQESKMIDILDVALMMVLLKVARVPDGKKASRDTMVDIAGYAAIGSTLNWT